MFWGERRQDILIFKCCGEEEAANICSLTSSERKSKRRLSWLNFRSKIKYDVSNLETILTLLQRIQRVPWSKLIKKRPRRLEYRNLSVRYNNYRHWDLSSGLNWERKDMASTGILYKKNCITCSYIIIKCAKDQINTSTEVLLYEWWPFSKCTFL